MKKLFQNRGSTIVQLAAWTTVSVLTLLATGCQSVESTALLADPELGTPATEELGELGRFIEIVAPVPGWWASDEEKRATWIDQDYKQDLARGFQAFTMPILQTPTLEEFMADPEQARVASPFIAVQVRERQQVTLKKRHQVITRNTFSRTASTRVEEIPTWSWWRWEQGGVTIPNEEISVVAVDLAEFHGVFSELGGQLDEEGRLRIPLSPFLDHVVGSGHGLQLRVTCPSLGLSTDVLVDQATLLHFQKRARHASEVEAWSKGE